MKIIGSFIEDSKNKFLKKIAPIDKGFEYYLGLILSEQSDKITEQCNEIFIKSNKNIKLIKMCEIDNNPLLIFEINPEFASNKINGILKSISKYLGADEYVVSYMNNLTTLIEDSWGEQKYFEIVDGDIAYSLKGVI